ncbi:hypothetical protein C7B64_04875 [Merismopedia glauca CCAP 1448/3]|uniref:Polysaccharide biosynthesis protein C-terminal domain-containing protein n=1 Tax=Merismopedia glauca CCAP 1448/3 TaxID=1296344 RepID=A0A2T1C7K1_9CYAN|nr:hypothetical protein C7B64_04875 [Merismopedia glauca CCAP 1448/3]
MPNKSAENHLYKTLASLWWEFLPLSLSDMTMAAGDPIISTTLAHLPLSRLNLAAVGIAKSWAIFLESPIIMILHASNALAPSAQSRRVLWKFVLLAGGCLSLLLGLLPLPFIYETLAGKLLGIPANLSDSVRKVLIIMILWPFAIAWRRYFQGLLIYDGTTKAIAVGAISRLIAVTGILLWGFILKIPGATLAASALIAGVLVEAVVVTWAAKISGATLPPETKVLPQLPTNLSDVWKFYAPLATSMLVVWGGRAILVGIVARAQDAEIALAAWPAAWGLVLVIANATRMVQQVIIKNRELIAQRLLIIFALTVGIACSLMLLLVSATPIGAGLLFAFFGNDLELVERVRPVLWLSSAVPMLVAMQNAIQGFLVAQGKTQGVNHSTWAGTIILLVVSSLAVQLGMNGALAASLAMLASLSTEISFLGLNLKILAR